MSEDLLLDVEGCVLHLKLSGGCVKTHAECVLTEESGDFSCLIGQIKVVAFGHIRRAEGTVEAIFGGTRITERSQIRKKMPGVKGRR